MSDLCIIYNDEVPNCSISASTTSGSTLAANMANDVKGKIHRSTSNTVTYTLTWTANATVGGLVFPATNLPADATVDVTVSNVTPTTLYSVIGATPFAHTDIANGFGFGYAGTATANHFAVGRYSSGYLIFDAVYTTVRTIVITITRTVGVIDCSRIMAGNVWRPSRYASNGIKYDFVDTSKTDRLTSGNIVVDQGYTYNTMSFDIRYMPEEDRQVLYKILRLTGTRKNIFITIFPSFTTRLRQDYAMYGKITQSPITYDVYNFYSYTVSMESW